MNLIVSHAIQRDLSYSCYKLTNGSLGTLPATARSLYYRVAGQDCQEASIRTVGARKVFKT